LSASTSSTVPEIMASSETYRAENGDEKVSAPVADRSRTFAREDPFDFVAAYRLEPYERLRIVKAGLPAEAVSGLARRMGMSTKRLVAILGLPVSRIRRSVSDGSRLRVDESSRVLGLARLIGQAQVIVEESGNPEGFD